jgi:hypothetical protein
MKQVRISAVIDFSTSDWPHWNSLSETFRDAFPTIQQNVYDAAGEIWPKAKKFARTQSLDDSDARELLLKAVVNVSKPECKDIRNLPRYVYKTYTRLVWKIVEEQKHHESLNSINEEMFGDAGAAALIDREVLLGEIVARMDAPMLRIYEGLILGYSFEELGRKYGEPANVLRSRFSRGLHRLARKINAPK